MILHEAEQRMKLISDNTRARIFSAKYNTRYLYPYALQHVNNCYPGVRNTCYELMLDSGMNDEEVTNRDIIERALELNPDYIMPKDYVGDRERTRESMREFFDLYEAVYRECAATPFVIIQPPYSEEYRMYKDFYEQFGHFALGGLQMFEPEEQVRRLERFRYEVGSNNYVHAFGIGTTLEVIRALRNNPRLIDSLDVSTAEMAISKNKIPDKTWKRSDFYIPEGVDSSSVRARFSAAILYMMNYMMGTRVDDDILKTEYEESTVLDEVADMQAEKREELKDEIADTKQVN